MLSNSLIICTILALLRYSATVQGGEVTVKLAENDFNAMEGQTLSVTVTVTGEQEFGDLHFQVSVLTEEQFQDQAPTCNGGISTPSGVAPADSADLSALTVICSRALGSSSRDVSCELEVIQDNILEREEYLLLILSVTDDANNTVTLGRNCGIGTIVAASNPVTGLSLTAVAEQVLVTEGNTTETFVSLRRNFESEVPIEITLSPSGTARLGPDYVFIEGQLGTHEVTFPANETRLKVPLVIKDDNLIESSEDLTISFRARVDLGSLTADIPVRPMTTTIRIVDNDVVTIGLNVSQPTITVTEGESITLCAAVTDPDLSQGLFRRSFDEGINVDFTTTDQTAKTNEDFTIVRPSRRVYLEFDQSLCYTYEMTENDIPERPRSFQVMVVDLTLAGITDPAEREHYMALNQIRQPGTVTISIVDNDGTPNKPIIMVGVPTKDLVFEWTIDEEDGLRPVDCYYGTITERVTRGATGPVRGTVESFTFCNKSEPTAQEHIFNKYDSSKEYIIVVCARNGLGENCSDPVTLSPTPPSLPLGPGPGLVAGIVVLVLVLVLCCVLLFVFLFLIFWFGWDKGGKYFPERREKKFGEYRHNAHSPMPADEFDTVGPLEYDI